jgi:hypothetical protein
MNGQFGNRLRLLVALSFALALLGTEIVAAELDDRPDIAVAVHGSTKVTPRRRPMTPRASS